MATEFKVKKGYRIILSLIAIFFCLSLFIDAYFYYYHETSTSSFQTSIILVVCTIVMLFFAIKSNGLRFQIHEDNLLIKSFLKTVKYYPISDIETVEIVSDRFPIVRIYFSNKKHISMMPIEGENDFIELLGENLKAIGKEWSFVKK